MSRPDASCLFDLLRHASNASDNKHCPDTPLFLPELELLAPFKPRIDRSSGTIERTKEPLLDSMPTLRCDVPKGVEIVIIPGKFRREAATVDAPTMTRKVWNFSVALCPIFEGELRNKVVFSQR
jgi:hypothetical protein